MKKFFALLLIFCAACSLSSCGYSHQVNEMAYVVGLGIDKGEENSVSVSLQFAKPMAISSSGGESEEKDKKKNQENSNTSLVSAEGKDIFSCIKVLERSLSKQINFTHTKILVFSESVARDGVLEFTESLMSNNQFRPNTYTAVSRTSAKEYFEKVKPILEQNPAKYYTLMFSKDTKTTVPDATLLDLYFSISGNEKCASLPVLDVQKNEDESDKKSENKADAGGMAVFYEGRLIEILEERYAECYNILTGKFRDGYFSIDDSGKPLCIRLKVKKTQIKVTADGDRITAIIKIKADVDPLSFSGKNDELETLANEEIQKKLTEFIEKNKEIMSDTIGFGNYLKKSFLTYDDFKNFNYMEKFNNLSAEISVKTKIGNGLLKR